MTTSGVLDYLLGRGVPFAVFPNKVASTALTTARGYGLERELVRTVALVAAVGPALAVVPWERELDLDLARTALRDTVARHATPDEIASRFPGVEADAIPPLGLFYLMPMVVDPEVVRMRQVAFPAGKASCVVAARRAQLFRGDVYLVAPLTPESLPERLPGARPRSPITSLPETEPTSYPG